MSSVREIKRLVKAQPTSDGDGVKIRRIVGFNDPIFSPYLMLDELKSDQSADYIGGFPPHPHRGMETLTYMLDGHFQHRDHLGHVGELKSGGAQWMFAGRGIIHSEMPIMKEGQLHGFQIWLNLPAVHKMDPARYHDFQPEVITEWSEEGMGLLRVIAGEVVLQGHEPLKGPLQDTGTSATIADWQAPVAHAALHYQVPEDTHVSLYVYKGEIDIGGTSVPQGVMAVLSAGQTVEILSSQPSGVLILMGQPIHEPVVHYGPFVMNTIQEIEQAISDYNSGKFEQYE